VKTKLYTNLVRTKSAGKRLTAAQRRESILNAAVEVFADAGYRGAKMSDIAARVGVTEPVIFQNFGSKAALFAAVLDRVAGDVQAEVTAMTGHFGSVSDLLEHVLGPDHVHEANAHGARGTLFAEAVTLTAEPGLTDAAGHTARTLARHLADLLRRGQAEGDIRDDVDPEAAAWLLLSVVSARQFRTAAMPGHSGLEDGVAALALRAVAAESAGGATPSQG
jgi:AcrR family transcriptional regulator